MTLFKSVIIDGSIKSKSTKLCLHRLIEAHELVDSNLDAWQLQSLLIYFGNR